MAAGAAGLTVLASPAQASTTTPEDALDQAALTTTLTGPELKSIQDRRYRPAWKVALDFALDKQGVPYLWGGTGRGGYDCSGLMLRAYEKAGIDLPRTAAEQYAAFGRKIAWNDLRPGDLVFFSGLGHVGMISRPGYMVHAPHSGDVVKEEKLSSWRRDAFVGAVRPDAKGVREWAERRAAPAPAMPVASVL
ncbi:C40 family peptidase [Actinomadura sp. ATCC 31491]|uniref:C40 family peptidase n=1 Tax=Actinomadura luzonensis TaxID=2805427 RepID=A0ABT0FKB7_9ACTN|nr:C40 family peptidase [Actinomadura luzonensis]MCK2212753.1 C40 family peptidase [Actinomadura luzonensis]